MVEATEAVVVWVIAPARYGSATVAVLIGTALAHSHH